MTRPERPFELPDGTTVVITKRTDDPATEGFELEMSIPPKATATPKHIHPAQTDEFDVVSGQLEVFLDDGWRVLGPGDRLVVEPGHVHTYRNEFSEPAVIRNVHAPAASFQEYIDRLEILFRTGRLTKQNNRMMRVYFAILFSEHTDCMVLSSPIERNAAALLAKVAKLLGVRVPRPDDK